MSQERRLVSAIHAITAGLSSNPSVDSSLESILRVCVEAVDAGGGTIYLHDPHRNELTFRYVLPAAMNEQLLGRSFPDDQGISGAVFTTGKSRVDNDVASSTEHSSQFDATTRHVTRCLITVPLLVPNADPVGVVQAVNKKSGDFTQEDLMVLEIVGGIAAMAIRNAQLAEEAKKATGLQAMGDIAHDIKNKVAPLTMGVMTLLIEIDTLASELPKMDARAEETLNSLRDIAAMIAEGAHRTHRYAQLIADLAKGKELVISKKEADLCATAAKEFFGLQRRARGKGVELVAQVDGPIVLPFDEVMLERAVYNLTLNAVEATPEGGKVVLGIDQSPREVAVRIADTGRGMPPDRLQQVLAGTAESSKEGGTGLGTSIVRKIAELHNGRLEAESKVGKGTTFRLVLPRS
jgi:signal transduction histidine kinase